MKFLAHAHNVKVDFIWGTKAREVYFFVDADMNIFLQSFLVILNQLLVSYFENPLVLSYFTAVIRNVESLLDTF